MRYIDRRFLFPVVAATAWAQQQSPETAAAEAAVRARAQTFFDLQVAKKFRQGEAMVAEESKDAYYDGPKFNIDSFTIAKVQVAEGNAAADVTIKAKVTLLVPALGQTIHTEAVQITHWKTENGEWVYFMEPEKGVMTPFGKPDPQAGAGKAAAAAGRPDLASMMKAVQADRNSVEIKPGENQTVKISNSLPGPVDVRMEGFSLAGLSGKLDKRHLEQGETTSLHIVASDAAAPGGSVTVVIDVSPLGIQLPVKVTVR
jgi:hypothetical protein